jgi:hypothetical protein
MPDPNDPTTPGDPPMDPPTPPNDPPVDPPLPPVDPPTPPVDPPVPARKRFVDLLDAEGAAQETLTADDDEIKAATDALAAVNQRLKDAGDKKAADLDKLKAADAAIASALTASGPRFIGPLKDGTVKVYTADGDGGYHVTTVRAADEEL